MLGKSLGSSLVSVALVTTTVAVVLAVLRQPVQLAGAGWLLLGLLVVLLSGTSVGVLIGSLFILSRHGPQLSSALMYPVYLLGGMLIPPDLVPGWLSWLSWGSAFAGCRTSWSPRRAAGRTCGRCSPPPGSPSVTGSPRRCSSAG